MVCLEAQSKIIAYVEGKLDRDEKKDFLTHVKNCSDCREELDIYYTMIEGMRQLDGNVPLSKDFSKELDERIDKELKSNRQKTGFFRSSVLIIIAMLLGVGIFGYVNFLNLLHEDEQNKIKEAQGEYYFSDTFDKYMFKKDDEPTLKINVTTVEEEPPTYYERVRQYKRIKN